MKKQLLIIVGLLGLCPHTYATEDIAQLIGKYDMELKVGETIFHDVLDIQEVKNDNAGGGTFRGTLTVPGVFTATLENAEYALNSHSFSVVLTLSFEIKANEHGSQFQVRYVGSLTYDEIIMGEARLEDGSLLGKFMAKRIPKD